MIAHISPADVHREESRNTLVYADRAKNISNKVMKDRYEARITSKCVIVRCTEMSWTFHSTSLSIRI